MAEFLNQTVSPVEYEDGFNAMGKPIPMFRRTAAVKHCRAMGMTDTGKIMACIGGMVVQLEKDKPYEAMAVGMRYLDLTGTYRIMSVLLVEPRPDEQPTAMG